MLLPVCIHTSSSEVTQNPKTETLSRQDCLNLFQETLKDAPQDTRNQHLYTSCIKNIKLFTDCLLEMGADPDGRIPHHKSKILFPLLFSSLHACDIDIFKYLLDDHRTNIVYTYQGRRVCLLHSAILHNREDVIAVILLSQKCLAEHLSMPFHALAVDGRVTYPETALAFSTRIYQPALLQRFITLGANPQQKFMCAENGPQEDWLTRAVELGSSSKTLTLILAQEPQESPRSEKASALLLHGLLRNPVMPCKEKGLSIKILLAHGITLAPLNNVSPLQTCLSVSIEGDPKAAYRSINEVAMYLLLLGVDVQDLYKDGKAPAFTQPLLRAYGRKIHEELVSRTGIPEEICNLIEEFLLSQPGPNYGNTRRQLKFDD